MNTLYNFTNGTTDAFISYEDTFTNTSSTQNNNNIKKEEELFESYFDYDRSYVKPSKIDIILHYFETDDNEMIPDVPVTFSQDSRVNLNNIIEHLKELSFPIQYKTLHYFDSDSKQYTMCGNEPFLNTTYIPNSCILYEHDHTLIKLGLSQPEPTFSSTQNALAKLGFPQQSFANDIENEEEEEKMPEPSTSPQDEFTTSSPSSEIPSPKSLSIQGEQPKKKTKRHQERTINEVLDLIDKWRSNYHGIYNPITGEKVTLSLTESAEKVGVPRKSLDDYLRFVKQAQIFGFDFKNNLTARFGLVRSFVKAQKKKSKAPNKKNQKSQSQLQKDEDDNIKALGFITLSKKIIKL